jgi:hypothetical protein
VGYTTDREFMALQRHVTLPRRFLFGCQDYTLLNTNCIFVFSGVFYSSVRFDDAIDRANTNALRRISMTLAFHAGGLLDQIGDAIAFGDGFGGAFGDAGAAGDAIFGNLHCHGSYSFKNLLLQLQN